MTIAGRLSGPEFRRYPDPATELEVIRLTDPAFASGMTAPHLRQFGRRGDTLLYWSERYGPTRQAFQIDLRSGESRQLTEVSALDPVSLVLSGDEKSIYYFDGPALTESTLSNQKSRPLHRIAEGAARTGMTSAMDGSLLFAENRSLMRALKSTITTVFKAEENIDQVIARPKRAQALYRSGGAFWLTNLDGAGRQQLKLEPGQTGDAVWTQSGETLLYLHIPENPAELITLREHDPTTGSDRLVSKTSQFQSVSPNTDSSVFVGASRSRANAYVLLLLRVTRRELTLCEHRASDPATVRPVFSPDSQSVFFTSDRHGKSALYRIKIEKFVETTPIEGF
jgi:oligogalacturonide lyase